MIFYIHVLPFRLFLSLDKCIRYGSQQKVYVLE